MVRQNTKSSFTLIELLVVIAIIAGLSALVVPNFMNIREKARDSQRKSDLKQIQKALELYKLNQATAVYPTGAGTPPTIGTVGSSWTESGVIYMNKIPGDPLGLTPTPYYYSRTSSLVYTLCACIENTADSDPNVSSGNCNANYICSNAKKYVLNQP